MGTEADDDHSVDDLEQFLLRKAKEHSFDSIDAFVKHHDKLNKDMFGDDGSQMAKSGKENMVPVAKPQVAAGADTPVVGTKRSFIDALTEEIEEEAKLTYKKSVEDSLKQQQIIYANIARNDPLRKVKLKMVAKMMAEVKETANRMLRATHRRFMKRKKTMKRLVKEMLPKFKNSVAQEMVRLVNVEDSDDANDDEEEYDDDDDEINKKTKESEAAI